MDAKLAWNLNVGLLCIAMNMYYMWEKNHCYHEDSFQLSRYTLSIFLYNFSMLQTLMSVRITIGTKISSAQMIMILMKVKIVILMTTSLVTGLLVRIYVVMTMQVKMINLISFVSTVLIWNYMHA